MAVFWILIIGFGGVFF